jgi:hypothetical protein
LRVLAASQVAFIITCVIESMRRSEFFTYTRVYSASDAVRISIDVVL